LYRASSTVVDASAYHVGERPYLLSQVTQAALDDLKRRKAARKAPAAAPRVPSVDPEAQRQRAEAHALLSEAKRRRAEAMELSDKIEAEAQAEAEVIRKSAREEGFAQGLSQGSESGYEEGLKKGEELGLGNWAELVARWQGLLDGTVKEKQRYLADRERILVELVMRVSARILMREVKSSPEDVQKRVAEAVKRAADRSSLVVHLHPEDLAKALEMDSAALRALGGVKQIEYLADDKVIRGGVLLQSASETIDAGMDTQLTEVVKGLLQEAYHAD
jgi:flagellar assembly protein FliH